MTQEAKQAINVLINRTTPKPEQLRTLEFNLNLANSEVEAAFWENIFEELGVKDGLSGIVRSESMMRLLAYRAIVIPDTLPVLLNWLQEVQFKQIKLSSKDNFKKAFDSFQEGVFKIIRSEQYFFPKIIQHLQQGVSVLIAEFTQNQSLLRSIVDLLQNDRGLWSSTLPQVIDEIDGKMNCFAELAPQPILSALPSLNVLKNFLEQEDNQPWKNLFTAIKPYWNKTQETPNLKYQSLAELFEQLEKVKNLSPETRKKLLKLTALFYKVSLGKMPKSVFDRLKIHFFATDSNCRKISDYEAQIYKLRVERRESSLERIQKSGMAILKNLPSRIERSGIHRSKLFWTFVFFYILFFFPLGKFTRPFIASFLYKTKLSQWTDKLDCLTPIVCSYPESQSALNQLTQDFKKHPTAEKTITNILTLGKFKDFKDMQKNPQKSIKLIKEYQEIHVGLSGAKVDGVIEPYDPSFKVLKCQLASVLGVKVISGITKEYVKPIPAKGRVFCKKFLQGKKIKVYRQDNQDIADVQEINIDLKLADRF